MKKIFTLVAVLISAATFWSCDDNIEELPILAPKTNPVIEAPATSGNYVLNFTEKDKLAERLIWSKANFTVDTEVTYTVEIDLNGRKFAKVKSLGSTKTTNLGFTVGALNTIITDGLLLAPFTPHNLQVRVKADVGGGVTPLYSDPIELNVTPYTTAVPKLAVPGNHQGWKPETAPVLAASEFGKTDFEGYVWLDGEHKFVAQDNLGKFAWGNTDWGDDGTFTGKLVEKNEKNAKAATAGHYYIKADTKKLTYSEVKYSWGLIGSATPDQWNSDQDMTFDKTKGTWTITLNLTAGEIKFRANDDWAWNYGDDGANKSVESGGANIKVSDAGNYTIVLDLGTPRDYKYTITKN
jgi:hypothetical protein